MKTTTTTTLVLGLVLSMAGTATAETPRRAPAKKEASAAKARRSPVRQAQRNRGRNTNRSKARKPTTVTGRRLNVLKTVKASPAPMVKALRRSLARLKATMERLKAAKASPATMKALKAAGGEVELVADSMTVRQCKRAMRQTFGPGTTRADRRRWLQKCESTYGVATQAMFGFGTRTSASKASTRTQLL